MYDRRPGYFRNEDQPTGRRVDAKVKWFNATKGFGFVTPSDGTQDAFLPMAILRRAGYDDIREGASVLCEIGAGAKGPLVVNVLNVDNSTAAPAGERRGPPAGGGYAAGGGGGYGGGGGGSGGFDRGAPRSTGPASSVDGSVKWFEPTKGFGFISPDGGGKDVFVHITALRRSGLESLDAGARVRVDVVEGRKGLEADRVTVI
jgi:CspA family cold shock protein